MKIEFLTLFMALLLLSCKQNERSGTSEQDDSVLDSIDQSIQPGETSFDKTFPDSLFPMSWAENSEFRNRLRYMTYDREKKFLFDPQLSAKFDQVDTSLKSRILAPILNMPEDYVRKFVLAFFVSKVTISNNVNLLTLYISGDDYTSLTAILFNDDVQYISHFNLWGGIYPGSYEINDSTFFQSDYRYSTISGNKINSSYVRHCSNLKRNLNYRDSISYLVKIDRFGFHESKLDSVRILE